MRVIGVSLLALALHAAIIGDVREAVGERDFGRAKSLLATAKSGGVTPEWLEAQSWLARGALAAKQYDQARAYAAETRQMVDAQLRNRKLDAEPHLPIALGAAIEVEAQARAAQGERAEAVAQLQKELASYRDSSVRARIQKNVHLLSLEGKPAPALRWREALGPRPVALAQLRGRPVLLFFWAHWCGDCKQQASLLARLAEEFAPQKLALIGPTQHYGYVAQGRDAAPAEETKYIDQVRRESYSLLSNMPVPVDDDTFKSYGASTTPTLVLVDRQGIVRLYHPGKMSYDELAAAVRRVL